MLMYSPIMERDCRCLWGLHGFLLFESFAPFLLGPVLLLLALLQLLLLQQQTHPYACEYLGSDLLRDTKRTSSFIYYLLRSIGKSVDANGKTDILIAQGSRQQFSHFLIVGIVGFDAKPD